MELKQVRYDRYRNKYNDILGVEVEDYSDVVDAISDIDPDYHVADRGEITVITYLDEDNNLVDLYYRKID